MGKEINETKEASLAVGIICGVIGLVVFGIPMGCVAIGIGNDVVKQGNNWGLCRFFLNRHPLQLGKA